MAGISRTRKTIVILVGMVLLLGLFPGIAAGQSGVGGTTIVAAGESVSSLSGVYGTIIIEGTVTGDVSGAAGNIVIRQGGVVEGNLEAAAGSIRIAGTVNGDVSMGAGSVDLTDNGVVEGDFDVGAGDVRLDGTINGNAQVGAENIRLGEGASMAGSLTYDGNLEGDRSAVQGEIIRERSLGPQGGQNLQFIASWLFTIGAFVVNLVLGVLLLALFPDFSASLAERVGTDPGKSGLVGLGTVIGIPIVLVLIGITVIGLPIALMGILLFVLFSWVALIYGRFAVGAWLLSLVGMEQKWVALVLGLVIAVILSRIPLIGELVNFLIFLLGLGALVLGLVVYRRRNDDSPGSKSMGEVYPD